MSKDSSAKYYQDNKKDYKENLVEDAKIILKRKKNKSNNTVVSDIKILQKMLNESWLSVENNITK